jgi:hypothetical protein
MDVLFDVRVISDAEFGIPLLVILDHLKTDTVPDCYSVPHAYEHGIPYELWFANVRPLAKLPEYQAVK